MNILYIVNSTRIIGGASKSFLTLVDGMKEKDVTPFVITPDKGDMYQVLREKDIFVTDVNLRANVYPNLHTIKDALFFLPRVVGRRLIERRASRWIYRFCSEHRIDLIHVNVSLLSCGLYASEKLFIPHVFHVREYVDKDFDFHYFPSKRAYYTALNSQLAYTVCITRGIQEHHRLTGHRTKVVYNGIELATSPQHSEFAPDSFFLFAGRIEPAKNPMQVVKAFHEFCQRRPENDITLKLAGPVTSDAYLAEIKNYVKQHGLSGKVEYLGIRRDIANLMHDARATIVPSDFEAFGRCLPEAMLQDCLTIGKDTAGTKEQFDNGLAECGSEIGLRYQTTEELANHMAALWPVIPPEFARTRENARAVVTKLYSKSSYINSIYSFYQEILPKHNQ